MIYTCLASTSAAASGLRELDTSFPPSLTTIGRAFDAPQHVARAITPLPSAYMMRSQASGRARRARRGYTTDGRCQAGIPRLRERVLPRLLIASLYADDDFDAAGR